MVDFANTLPGSGTGNQADTPFAATVDRWIYVFMAASFIVYTLVGFVPDSMGKMAAVSAGQRPPFPLALHAHAVLMGTFLLLLLTQTVLAATGRLQYHRALGVVGAMLGYTLVIVGLVLVPTMYHQFAGMAQAAPAEVRPMIEQGLHVFRNIILIQLRVGILFAIFLTIALAARRSDLGLHKRMMFIAVSTALPAAFDRMQWLPTTMPGGTLSIEIYAALAIAPMFLWDLYRTGRIHRAYVIWAAVTVPAAIIMAALWDTPWWQAMAPKIVGM